MKLNIKIEKLRFDLFKYNKFKNKNEMNYI